MDCGGKRQRDTALASRALEYETYDRLNPGSAGSQSAVAAPLCRRSP